VRALVRFIETISRSIGYLAAALVFALIVLMIYEVVVRYLFNAPTTWGYEVTTWVMGASFMLAIGYALVTGSHVRIDFLHDLLGDRAKHGFDLVGYVIVLPLLVWLTYGLWDYFYGSFVTGERTGQSSWNPRVWPFRLVLFVGVLVWTLQTIAEVVKSTLALVARPVGEPEPLGPPD
jgi:TRAP-type mannitol/chloroaromatic compound transport system permease small subunit